MIFSLRAVSLRVSEPGAVATGSTTFIGLTVPVAIAPGSDTHENFLPIRSFDNVLCQMISPPVSLNQSQIAQNSLEIAWPSFVLLMLFVRRLSALRRLPQFLTTSSIPPKRANWLREIPGAFCTYRVR